MLLRSERQHARKLQLGMNVCGHETHLEAACALEVVPVKFGKTWSWLGSRLSSGLLFFFRFGQLS